MARSEIERGLFGDVDSDEDSGVVKVSEEEFRNMGEELEELRQRVNVMTQVRPSGWDCWNSVPTRTPTRAGSTKIRRTRGHHVSYYI